MVRRPPALLLFRVPKSSLFSDCRGASLGVGVAHSAVKVDDRLLDALVAVEIQGALVDGIAHQKGCARSPRPNPRSREHEAVNNSSASIANGGGRRKRQHEVGTALHSPNRQRL